MTETVLDALAARPSLWIAVAVVATAAVLALALRLRKPRVLVGPVWVTDGDGVRVRGRKVRIAGIDAPEWDQRAQDADGNWFAHGAQVKRALIDKIGGTRVRVDVEEWDRFGRAVGTVYTLDGRDIGEWLVREGHAHAARDDRYREVEQEARDASRGMWSHRRNIDPQAWRHVARRKRKRK